MDKQDMEKDLAKISAIDAVAISEGGKALVDALVKDVVNGLDTLCTRYAELSLQEFISLCADMKSKLDIARVICRSKKNKEELEQLIANTIKE